MGEDLLGCRVHDAFSGDADVLAAMASTGRTRLRARQSGLSKIPSTAASRRPRPSVYRSFVVDKVKLDIRELDPSKGDQPDAGRDAGKIPLVRASALVWHRYSESGVSPAADLGGVGGP